MLPPAGGGRATGRRSGAGTKTAALRLVREERADERARTQPAAGDETERARQLCLTELDRAPRTRAELAAVLQRKEVSAEVADAVLTRFTEAGLVDDAALAESWVSTRHRDKRLSRGALSQELRRKGVDEEVVAEAVSVIDADDELAAARALIQRKQRATAGLEPQVRVRRLVGLLARKGYPAGVAFQVVRDVLAEESAESAAYDDLTAP